MIRARTAPASTRAPRWTATAGSGLVGLSLVLSGCATSEAPTTTASAAPHTYLNGVLATPSATSADPLQGDRDFAQALLMNHRDAVQHAETLLGMDGVDGDIRKTAEGIRDSHRERIGVLEGRLAEWGVQPSATPEATPSASLPVDEQAAVDGQVTTQAIRAGVLTPTEKEVLASADSEDAGRIYLLQMHRLLQSALTLARTELQKGTDEATRRAAEDMTSRHTQTLQEIVDRLSAMGAIAGDAPETAQPSGFTGPIDIKGAGAEGGSVDFTPSDVPAVRSRVEQDRRAQATPSPTGATPSPADTARPTPSASASAPRG